MTPGCTGKKSYSTPGMARKAAKKARRDEAAAINRTAQ